MRLIAFGAVASSVGIVLAAGASGTAGAVITLAGWLAFIAGIHRFGRAG